MLTLVPRLARRRVLLGLALLLPIALWALLVERASWRPRVLQVGFPVMDVEFSGDGRRLRLQDENYLVHEFDANTGHPVGLVFPPDCDLAERISPCNLSPDGRRELTCSAKFRYEQAPSVDLRDASTHRVLAHVNQAVLPYEWSKFSPDGRWL